MGGKGSPMAQKPETKFIQKINKLLPKTVYYEKRANPFRGGAPDMYYEGPKGILNVEYKWFNRVPKTFNLCESKGATRLSALQQSWLRRAYLNGQPAAVIVGSPKTCFILTDLDWEANITTEDKPLKHSPKTIATWIIHEVLYDISSTLSA